MLSTSKPLGLKTANNSPVKKQDQLLCVELLQVNKLDQMNYRKHLIGHCRNKMFSISDHFYNDLKSQIAEEFKSLSS